MKKLLLIALATVSLGVTYQIGKGSHEPVVLAPVTTTTTVPPAPQPEVTTTTLAPVPTTQPPTAPAPKKPASKPTTTTSTTYPETCVSQSYPITVSPENCSTTTTRPSPTTTTTLPRTCANQPAVKTGGQRSLENFEQVQKGMWGNEALSLLGPTTRTWQSVDSNNLTTTYYEWGSPGSSNETTVAVQYCLVIWKSLYYPTPSTTTTMPPTTTTTVRPAPKVLLSQSGTGDGSYSFTVTGKYPRITVEYDITHDTEVPNRDNWSVEAFYYKDPSHLVRMSWSGYDGQYGPSYNPGDQLLAIQPGITSYYVKIESYSGKPWSVRVTERE